MVGLLLLFLLRDNSPSTDETSEITVYCAAGLRKPVEELALQFREETGTAVRLVYGSSGELESKLIIDAANRVQRCDLYIPADYDFAQRTKETGLTQESLPIAQFRLVLAVKPDNNDPITKVDDLLSLHLRYALCDEHAGVGNKTKVVLSAMGLWEAIDQGKKVSFPRVPEAASAVKSSADIDAAFIWDATARQFGLKLLDLPELSIGVARISANVTAGAAHPTTALRFARYLAAPKNGPIFKKHYFEPTTGDPWEFSPEITLFCGGINRNAVGETLREFEKREGCKITTEYAGCGTLVASMQVGKTGFPDAFLTCDASYMDMVGNQFRSPNDVSSAQIVFLIREGNPKNIRKLEDLAQPGLKIGTSDRRMSTLGTLSWEMFESAGVKDAIEEQKTVVVTTPTAHELMLQMQGSTKLDVVLVYNANCQNLVEGFEAIAIEHPRARTLQNIAVAKTSRFPALTGRLMEAITSATSRERFITNGFGWEAAH